MTTCGKRAPGVLRSLTGICSKAGHSKIISGARRTVIATFLAMHKFHGPAQRRFYQFAQGDHGAPKRKSVTPVTAFSVGLHLLWVGRSSTGGPHAKAPNSCIGPSGCFLSWRDGWIYARPA